MSLLGGDADANDRAWHAAGGDPQKHPHREAVEQWLNPVAADGAEQKVMRMLSGGAS